MRIVICVKAVRSDLLGENSNRAISAVMNPYDLFAFKDVLSVPKNADCSITCLSMGALSAQDILIRCLAMGADQGVLLCDSAFSGADTVATTYVLDSAMKKLAPYSLIVCGYQSIDGETGQVVYGLAQRLQIPCIANVKKIVEINDSSAVLKIFSDECINTVRIRLPVVISYRDFTMIWENINLLSLKKAKKKGITIYNAQELDVDINRCGIKGSKTKVLQVSQDDLSRKNAGIKVTTGSCSEKAHFICRIIERREHRYHG
jgi:electron transfer flavoprotein beta subunit